MITEEKMNDSIYNEPYVVKNGCLYEMTAVKDQTIPVKLADFVPTLSEEITRDDGTEMQKFFRVSGVHRTGVVLPEVLVSAEEMQSMKWLLAVTFLSPLNHFLKKAGYEPKFVNALIGRTGSRKSTLAALFLSFFGKFSASDLPMSFHDTANSILANTYYLKDVLTCIDDFHPSSEFREQDMKNIAQDISRYYGDRIGRARLNSRSKLQSSRPPTGNALIMAEYAPDLSVSGNARYFNIELNEEDVQLDMLSEYQQLAARGVLNGIMRMYVEWLSNSFLADEKNFAATLANLFLKYRNHFMKMLSENQIKFHNRTPDMLSHLKIGLEFMLCFLLAHEMLSDSESDEIHNTFEEILISSTSENSEILMTENPTYKFLEKLQSLLDSCQCYVETKGAASTPRQKNCIGLQDDVFYYLFADKAHAEVKNFVQSKVNILRSRKPIY